MLPTSVRAPFDGCRTNGIKAEAHETLVPAGLYLELGRADKPLSETVVGSKRYGVYMDSSCLMLASA